MFSGILWESAVNSTGLAATGSKANSPASLGLPDLAQSFNWPELSGQLSLGSLSLASCHWEVLSLASSHWQVSHWPALTGKSLTGQLSLGSPFIVHSYWEVHSLASSPCKSSHWPAFTGKSLIGNHARNGTLGNEPCFVGTKQRRT